MAREIQPTPVLEGQEALDFLNKLESARYFKTLFRKEESDNK